MVPRPSWRRPWGCWALHAGLWLSTYGAFVLLLGRPWFAAAVVSALLLLLVLVNNAKMRALREPFVFQDYEYFTDALRHPRLYIPFLGWGKALAATLGFVLALAVGLGLEDRISVTGQLSGMATACALGALLLAVGFRQHLPVSFQPERDVALLGLLPSLWRYAMEGPMRRSSAFPRAKPPGLIPSSACCSNSPGRRWRTAGRYRPLSPVPIARFM